MVSPDYLRLIAMVRRRMNGLYREFWLFCPTCGKGCIVIPRLGCIGC